MTIFAIFEKPGRRPHPNPLPEGEGSCLNCDLFDFADYPDRSYALEDFTPTLTLPLRGREFYSQARNSYPDSPIKNQGNQVNHANHSSDNSAQVGAAISWLQRL